MNDFYRECLIKKVLTPKERATRAFFIGAISFILVAFGFMGLFLFISIARWLFLLCVVLLVLDKAYFNKFLYKLSFKIEYEYTLTNNLLDVDKIIAESDRLRLLSLEMKDIILMSKMNQISSAEFDGQFKTVCEACRDITDLENNYCIIAENDRYGKIKLIFTPNESMVDSITPYLGKRLRINDYTKNTRSKE